MNGNINFEQIYNRQVEFQKYLMQMDNLPADEPRWYSYHMLAMIEEMGEALKSDKRWKTHRHVYKPNEKIDEIADMFITLMNVCIFSNITPDKLLQAVNSKITENYKRVNKEMNINGKNNNSGGD